MTLFKAHQLRTLKRNLLSEDEQIIEKQLNKIMKKFNKVASRAVKQNLPNVIFTIQHMESEIKKVEIFNKFVNDMRDNGYKVVWYDPYKYEDVGIYDDPSKNYTTIVISWE